LLEELSGAGTGEHLVYLLDCFDHADVLLRGGSRKKRLGMSRSFFASRTHQLNFLETLLLGVCVVDVFLVESGGAACPFYNSV